MKKVIASLVAMVCLLLTMSAQATTVYYQPTPFPLKKSDGTAMPQDLSIIHSHTGYVRSSAPDLSFFNDQNLMIGGWGDVYRTYMNWDFSGLPSNPDNVILWARSYPPISPATQTSFQMCIPNTLWNTSMTWNTQPGFLGCTSSTSPFTFPTTDNWWGIYITGWYQNWMNATWPKDGVMFNPLYANNNFDFLRSSRYVSDGYRPILQFDFTPTLDLKMPLPGGYTWLLTTEVGGYDCLAKDPQYWPDTAHQGSNYFSIDITSTGSGYPTSVPILAAAGGKVVFAGKVDLPDPRAANGYYVIIDHDGDGDSNTGFQTRYLHLANPPARKNGTLLAVNNIVQQGDQIGIMGTTGVLPNGQPSSTGVHLHFGVRYQDNGASTVPSLTKVIMEGLLLKSYQTECAVDSTGKPTGWIRRYPSTLSPTGL